jgi:ribokinase
MKPKIVVVGSSNTDMVVKVNHLPEPGETVLGNNFLQVQGGKGANQAVAAARLGAMVTFVARVGQDSFGKNSVAAYQFEGIDTQFIVHDEGAPSGVALIMVNQAGENIIAVASGANAELSPVDILAAETAFREADCLLVQLEIMPETVRAAVNLAAEYQVPVILNPAPATWIPVDVLDMVDYLTPNEMEACVLASGDALTSPSELAKRLKSKYKLKNIVITLGSKGALIASDYNEIVPACAVNPVDTTGAGDAFNGGLAVALARGNSLIEAVKFANAVAALSTTRPGAQISFPRLEYAQAFLLNHR